MDNVTFSSPIPSRAIYEMTVDDVFSVVNSNFTTINSGAFIFQGKVVFASVSSVAHVYLIDFFLTEINSFRFQGNFIEEMTGASLQMPVKQSILIQDNTILSLSSTAFRCEFIMIISRFDGN